MFNKGLSSKLRFDIVTGLIVLVCTAFTTCDALGGDPTYTIVFNDGNGRSESATFRLGYSNALDKTVFEREGHTFIGWSTTPDGDPVVTREDVNRLITRVGQSVTLYAIWEAHTYRVVYDPNGGSGERRKDTRTFTFGEPQNLRTREYLGFTHGNSEYSFYGWARDQNSSEREFYDGAGGDTALNLTAEDNGKVTLYALWRPDGGVITPPGEFTFARREDGYAVTGFNGTETDVVIPDRHNGLSVVAIEDGAFQSERLDSVIIPDTVTSIGDRAFQDNLLTDVTIPDSVITIGNAAFQDNILDTVTIGNSVGSIGEMAFSGNRLITVTIPDSVESIGNSAFAYNRLTSVFTRFPSVGAADFAWGEGDDWRLGIPENVISSSEGLTFNRIVTGYTVTGFSPDTTPTRVLVIPHNRSGTLVIDISNGALVESQLTHVIIPNSVESIGDWAFLDNQLTDITIPDSVETIGSRAFANNQLTSVTIGNSVTSIGFDAFRDNQLTDITIPDSVETIGNNAFANNQLTNISIPDSVETIESGAFQDNVLTGVTIGNNVISIGASAFRNNQLTSVTIPGSVTSIGIWAFRDNQLTSVIIGNGVTSIVAEAFVGNDLTTITMPAGLTNIGSDAMGTLHSSFLEFYIDQNRQAGTYIFNGTWMRY